MEFRPLAPLEGSEMRQPNHEPTSAFKSESPEPSAELGVTHEAGRVWQRDVHDANATANRGLVDVHAQDNVRLREWIARQDERIARQDEQIVRSHEQLARKDEQIARKDEQIARLDEQIARQGERIARQDEHIACRDKRIARLLEEGNKLETGTESAVQAVQAVQQLVPRRLSPQNHSADELPLRRSTEPQQTEEGLPRLSKRQRLGERDLFAQRPPPPLRPKSFQTAAQSSSHGPRDESSPRSLIANYARQDLLSASRDHSPTRSQPAASTGGTSGGLAETFHRGDHHLPLDIKVLLGRNDDGTAILADLDTLSGDLQHAITEVAVSWKTSKLTKQNPSKWESRLLHTPNSCAYVYTANNSNTEWTVKEGKFWACMRCSNLQRFCFFPHDDEDGNKVMCLLPLHPVLADPSDPTDFGKYRSKETNALGRGGRHVDSRDLWTKNLK